MLTMPVARHRPTSLIMFFPSLPLKLYSDLTRILLQWVESLWKSISGPKFAYSHLDAPHDARGYLASMDVGLFQHLKNMQRLENTITILMGDHGPPHGHESALQPAPFLSVVLSDDAAQAKYRQILKTNAHRLVTPRDLYATLIHLGNLTAEDDPILAPQALGQPMKTAFHSRSFFREIAANRTCEQAGLAKDHCVCEDLSIPVSEKHVDLVVQAFMEIANEQNKKHNDGILLDGDTWPCAWLHFSRVSASSAKQINNDVLLKVSIVLQEGAAPKIDGAAEEPTEFSVDAWVPVNQMNPNEGSVRIISAEQITRYKKYEACTPQGADVRYCVCEVLRL